MERVEESQAGIPQFPLQSLLAMMTTMTVATMMMTTVVTLLFLRQPESQEANQEANQEASQEASLEASQEASQVERAWLLMHHLFHHRWNPHITQAMMMTTMTVVRPARLERDRFVHLQDPTQIGKQRTPPDLSAGCSYAGHRIQLCYCQPRSISALRLSR